MSKTLGLDLGTNSIGWAVVDDQSDTPIVEKGVIVFPEGVKIEKGTEKSRAAERTGFRGTRKLKFRRKLRKYETLKVLSKFNLCPLTLVEVEDWRKSNFKEYPNKPAFIEWLKTDDKTNKVPYFFRNKFSREVSAWGNDETLRHQLGRAFYHLAQRRGFKSNRLEQSDENLISDVKEFIQDALADSQNGVELLIQLATIFEEYNFDTRKADELDSTEQKLKSIRKYIFGVLENKIKNKDYSSYQTAKKEIDRYINRPENLGAVKGGIKELSKKIAEKDCQSLGQYFWLLYQKDRKVENHKIRSNYTSREEHYETEFNLICKTQNISDKLKKMLYQAIFFQRPLRSQKGLVGKCTLENNKARCPVSRTEFEAFRMWSFLNSIKIKTKTDTSLRELTMVEKELLIPKFYRRKSTFKFDDLAQTLSKHYGDKFVHFKDTVPNGNTNLINFKLNTTVNGCPVSAMFNYFFGANWETKKFIYETLDIDGLKQVHEIDYKDIWHVLSTFDDDKKLYSYAIEKLRLEEKEAKKFSKLSFQQGYANLSLSAINKILAWLKQGLKYPHAVFLANMEKVVRPEIWSDKTDKKMLIDAVGTILNEHSFEKKRNRTINALIAQYNAEVNQVQMSEESSPIIKNELKVLLSKTFGQSLSDPILDDAFNLLKKQLEKDSFSIAFIPDKRLDEMLHEFLESNNLIKDTNKLKKLYHPSDLESFQPINAKNRAGEYILVDNEPLKILNSPKTGAIKNPVLMRTMHQLRNLINELLLQEKINAKTRIHIELAREVNDSNKRAAYKTWQDQKQAENEEIASIIRELFKESGKKEVTIGSEDIKKVKAWTEQLKDENEKPVDVFELGKTKKEMVQKYKLWKEQKGYCIYTGKTINLTQLFEGTAFDIEHTIPRSVSWDNSMENKTISDATYNRETKRNKIPSELDAHPEILGRIRHWKTHWKKLDDQIKRINTATIIDKEAKDRMIRKKHLLRFEYDYWYQKYDRFIMRDVPSGFKNSQLVDTGLITRYAKSYLGSLFQNKNGNSNVSVVKGSVVYEFRKAWGVQKLQEKKSRSNHIHHCIDAVTIACMTRSKYNTFVQAWKENEEGSKLLTRDTTPIKKPWVTFTEDLLKIETEVAIVRAFRDNKSNQTKKKVRKRGKIEYKIEFEKDNDAVYLRADDGNKIPVLDQSGNPKKIVDRDGKAIPRYETGDTAKGSLHQDTFYGAIKTAKRDKNNIPLRDENGNFVFEADKKGNPLINYVIRKPLDSLTDADLKKIVDPTTREIVIKARAEEKTLKKELDSLKKELKKELIEIEVKELSERIERLEQKIKNDLYVIPPKKGKRIITPIRKVRINAKMTEPLPDFKKHKDISKHPHKREYYVQNDENYCLALFENKANKKRKAEIINLMNAVNYFKKSNSKENHVLIPESKKGFELCGILKPNTMVLFYEELPEEVWDLDKTEQLKRLYYVRKMSKDGRATFQFHQEARIDEQLKQDYLKQNNVEAPKSLTNGESKIDFSNLPTPKFLLSPNNMQFLIENVDFKVSVTGEIIKL
ncbi:MAG: hypothetical protein GQ574_01880 [Crocinitomix sp.]|nr:hypothetical protein [Crocinitomix sp.]